MNVKKRKIPKVAQVALVVVGLSLYGFLGHMLVVGPKKDEAAALQVEIDTTYAKVAEYQRLAAEAGAKERIESADLFHLTKAMPNDEDISGVLLEMNRVARESGITFESIKPGVPVLQTTYRVVPIEVFFVGNFYSLADFLYRVRTLVYVQNGKLSATGRLFAVDTIEFTVEEENFRGITAKLTVDAYMYGSGTAAPATTAPPITSTDTTATAETTPAAPEDAGGSAAGTP
jgi:Tfp pilus assembly protein PilO